MTEAELAEARLDALLDAEREIAALRREVSYLRACVPPTRPTDYGHEVWTETVRAEVKTERAAVVAWLRGFDTESASSDIRWCIRGLANCIERGEHRREEEK